MANSLTYLEDEKLTRHSESSLKRLAAGEGIRLGRRDCRDVRCQSRTCTLRKELEVSRIKIGALVDALRAAREAERDSRVGFSRHHGIGTHLPYGGDTGATFSGPWLGPHSAAYASHQQQIHPTTSRQHQSAYGGDLSDLPSEGVVRRPSRSLNSIHEQLYNAQTNEMIISQQADQQTVSILDYRRIYEAEASLRRPSSSAAGLVGSEPGVRHRSNSSALMPEQIETIL